MAEGNESNIYVNAWHGEQPYDAKEAVRLERACEMFIAHAESLAPERRYRLLDIGCGIGPLRRWLDAERFEIVGLELSEEAAELARGSYDDCTVGNVEEPWPVEAGSFDGVHAGAIMEHVVNWHKPLNHANAALADGGQLVISTPNLRYWKEIRRLIRGRQPHWIKHMGHLHGYTPTFLKQLVSLHGFDVVQFQADRVNLPLLKWCDRKMSRWFAGIGSVMILAAIQQPRVRIEHEDLAHTFPNNTPVGMGAIEVHRFDCGMRISDCGIGIMRFRAALRYPCSPRKKSSRHPPVQDRQEAATQPATPGFRSAVKSVTADRAPFW